MATATAITKADTEPAHEYYARVLLDLIHPDPDQPRKTFDEVALEELADSIKLHGVVVPIKLRPHPTKAKNFFLIAGERRWRASKIAKAVDIPAVIEERKLTPAAILEQQILENSQRENVPPLEEAEAYQTLLKDHHYTMELLIQKTGRSKAHLYGRVRLTKLPTFVKKAMIDGTLHPAIAELATRLHDAKLQERFARECLGEGKRNDYREAGVDPEDFGDDDTKPQDSTIQPLSYRGALTLLRRRYMLRLEGAAFQITDATLVPKAGACTTCPKRTGNQPGLPGLENTAKSDDLCTDPACFEEKTGAQWKSAAAAAKAKGIEVVDQKKAKDFFQWNDELGSNAPVATLDQKLPYGLDKTPGSNATFGKLLGKEAASVPRILVQDPSGAPREMLDKDAAIKKLKELGKIDDGKTKTSKREREQAKADRAAREKDKAKEEIQQKAYRLLVNDAVASAAKLDAKKDLAFLRLVTREFINRIDYGADVLMQERRGLKSLKDVQHIHETLKTAGDLRGAIVEVMLLELSDGVIGTYQQSEHKGFFADLTKLLGVDWTKAQAAAKEATPCGEKRTDAVCSLPVGHKGKHHGESKTHLCEWETNGAAVWDPKPATKPATKAPKKKGKSK